jgi:hypothetical protein
MDQAMTLTGKAMVDDLHSLPPEQKIEALLALAEQLIPELKIVVDDIRPFEEVFAAYGEAITAGRRWLRGEMCDPDEVMDPVYGSNVRPVWDIELAHKDSGHFKDLRVLGSLLTNALLYAGQIQFERNGDRDVPEPLEGEFTDDELVGEIQRTLSAADPALTEKFRKSWQARFHS